MASSQVVLEIDDKAAQSIERLMHHYNLRNRAELFSRALSALEVAAYIDNTQGELIARKDGKETKILMR